MSAESASAGSMKPGSPTSGARTLLDKIWDAHQVAQETAATPAVLYVDLHLVHEVTSPQAFSELRMRGLPVRRPDRVVATMDHSTPTLPADASGKRPYLDKQTEAQVAMLAALRVFATQAAHVIQQGFHPVADFLALGIKQAQLRQQQEGVLANRFGTAGAERQGWRAENWLQLFRRPATNAKLCEQCF